ncbi:Lar family restriction alleviation protein [Cupriavidus taiwanensis]|uniref:Uncharacterized protein n=1 Tax=Cupriavidus taiwanensis TaxID=164546 RepID=A0A7Z7JHJ2_9BURK|nr:Lar family restriction alleviation protein [Cupriavidus taiwanensis]SOZ17376.1 hypothetical protein CBM2597_U10198 [Cupriavidus taiwanensis]SOZ96343.1 hypothetical protein CBM2598_U10153 [Cupriavidus taiwanensis]SPC25703.1 hypothetical protein CBM2594_U10204 [Cupriavidus taiwanensis]
MTVTLNFNEALSGLDFISNRTFMTKEPAERRVYTLRLIERLIDQLDSQAREATDSEDFYLRRALACCAAGTYEEAVDYAFRAAEVGSTPVYNGGIDLQDRTSSLRKLLDAARASDEKLVLKPCPRCREQDKVDAEFHPGTAYVICLACGHKGPERLPREDVSRRALLESVVRAWNSLDR